jgi:ribosome-associated protein
MKRTDSTTELLLSSIIEGIHEKKGQRVSTVDMRKLDGRMADFFVICHASSGSQVSAICDCVEETVRRQAGEKPLRVEGLENCFWVLIDYGNVVVHIFIDEYRNFYSLESLWADAKIENIEDKKATDNGHS